MNIALVDNYFFENIFAHECVTQLFRASLDRFMRHKVRG